MSDYGRVGQNKIRGMKIDPAAPFPGSGTRPGIVESRVVDAENASFVGIDGRTIIIKDIVPIKQTIVDESSNIEFGSTSAHKEGAALVGIVIQEIAFVNIELGISLAEGGRTVIATDNGKGPAAIPMITLIVYRF